MNIREINMSLETSLFHMRRYIDQAQFIMQDVMEDYFFIEEENEERLGHILAYGFKRAGAKAGVVDDVLRYMESHLMALEALAKKIDKAVEQEAKKGTAA